MKQTTVMITIAALILMFISIVSWVLKNDSFALVSSNLATVSLLIVYLWDNRNNDKN